VPVSRPGNALLDAPHPRGLGLIMFIRAEFIRGFTLQAGAR